MRAGRFIFLAVLCGAPAIRAQPPDYEVFKKSIEPIFAKERPGHARCIICHSLASNPFHLLPPGEDGTWTEEQSRRNYEAVLARVNLDLPESSKLLLHPLAPEAGGDPFHSGGRQFLSKDDADWQTLASWVRAGKSAGASALDPIERWRLDFETGVLWRFTGSATPLNYVFLPQFLTVVSPEVFRWPAGGGELVLRSRYSLMLEPIVAGPEHHYYAAAASGLLEWWNQRRTECLFFSSGGGFGWLDARGYQIAGAQGQEFNLNWLAYGGGRWRWGKRWTAGVGIYFQHVSNGHLDKVDPGVNAIGPLVNLGLRY